MPDDRPVVSLARLSSYDGQAVARALAAAVEPFGGFAGLGLAGARVCLKVNLLRGAKPADAVTTHSAIVAAVARALREAGATPFLADSPGAGLPYNRRTLEKSYRRAGYLSLAEDIGLELNYDTNYRTVHFDGGRVAKRFDVITPVLAADAVINLCKLKTHGFTYLTGAVKNLFGVLPGFAKPAYHARMRRVDNFAEVLLDIAEFIKPALNIMDAVVAMEGNGPGAGEPREVGLLLAAPSALALDVAAGVITGLSPESHPVVRAAAKRGLTPSRPEDLKVVGPALAGLKIDDWKWPPTVVAEVGFVEHRLLQGVLAAVFRSGFSVQPRVRRERCTGCGLCRESCPVEAIEIIDNKSCIDEDRCIRCYCCHEACAYEAIELHRSLLHRLVARMPI